MTDPFAETGEHYTSLNEHHQMGRARDINLRRLEDHLVFNHGLKLTGGETKADLGRMHTLVHAVIGNEDLRILLNLPDRFGQG